MDTSEQYIEMCRKAVKVQENWRAKSGDIFAYHSDNSFSDNFGLYVGDIPGRNLKSRHFIRDAGGIKKPLKEIPTDLIWLPRQDDLQGMVVIEKSEWFLTGIATYDTYGFSKEIEYYSHFDSFEKLWLCFVMEKKYNKIWDGSEWVINNG